MHAGSENIYDESELSGGRLPHAHSGAQRDRQRVCSLPESNLIALWRERLFR